MIVSGHRSGLCPIQTNLATAPSTHGLGSYSPATMVIYSAAASLGALYPSFQSAKQTGSSWSCFSSSATRSLTFIERLPKRADGGCHTPDSSHCFVGLL